MEDILAIQAIVIALLTLMLIDGNNMTPYQATESIKVCEVNGGLKQVEVSPALNKGNITVYCNNGAQFSIRYAVGGVE